jgi:hypothetical protein
MLEITLAFKGARMAKKNYNVSPEEFVVAWQMSKTAEEAAQRLGMPKGIVLARASFYREKGVNLKTMKRGKKKLLDVQALNRVIDNLDTQHGHIN